MSLINRLPSLILRLSPRALAKTGPDWAPSPKRPFGGCATRNHAKLKNISWGPRLPKAVTKV